MRSEIVLTLTAPSAIFVAVLDTGVSSRDASESEKRSVRDEANERLKGNLSREDESRKRKDGI